MSAFIPIDQAERDRIRTDLDANLCVEAGAGTGKTTVLVDRVVEVLRTGYATVDEIAVITFTEAAAAELAARVRQRAREGARQRDRRGARADPAALDRPPSRAHRDDPRLRRESAARASGRGGARPGFEVLDDLAAQLAFDARLRGLAARAPRRRSARRSSTAIRRGFDLQQIRRLVETVRRPPDAAPAHARDRRRPAPSSLIAELVEARPTSAAACCRDAGNDETGIDRHAPDHRATPTRSQPSATTPPSSIARSSTARPGCRPGRGRKDDWDDPARCRRSKAAAQAGARGDRGSRKPRCAARRSSRCCRSPSSSSPTTRRSGRQRERPTSTTCSSGRATCSRRAARRATTSAAASGSILVDEFQDTDPVQAEIALCIASDDEPGDDWLELRPRPGSLTVVGDPKQSIYRFRRADIAVYDAVRHGPLADGDARLVQNFRSVAGVIDWANERLRPRPRRAGGRPAGEHAAWLSATPASATSRSRSASSTAKPADDSADGDPHRRGTPARDDDPARDRDGLARPRPRDRRPSDDADYGDVVVLVPRRTALDTYLEAFRRANVPVRAEGGRSFFQRQEVRDLANILQAIDDPLDQVALVAALRSSVVRLQRRGDLPPPRRRLPLRLPARLSRQPRQRRATRC